MKEPKELGFVVEEILLNEAKTLVSAGEGKYSDLLIMLSRVLPDIEKKNMDAPGDEKKGFAFGLPGSKELEEKERRSLCNSVNLRLRRSGINWGIHYSGNRKLFVCVPSFVEPRREPKKFVERKPRASFEKKRQEILALQAQGLTLRAIARKLGIANTTVDYRLGQHSQSPKIEKTPLVSTPESFVELARKVLNFHEPFTTSFSCRPARNAISIVGVQDLKFTGASLDPLVGCKIGAVNYNANHARVGPEVAILRQALKQKGVIQ